MIDIFDHYTLQREELLARIAQELQLDKTRIGRMESAYNAVADLLKKDVDFFDDLIIEVYAQGSKRIGTTVRPINDGDFDLDVVLHIYDPYYNYKPEEIYDALVSVLENHAYYKSIMEKKTRCVRLNYKSDFHMDILPACMPSETEKEAIMIPEKAKKIWSSGNPKGFSNWFLAIANSIEEFVLERFAQELLKAQIETEELPKEVYLKTPLQRAVQLIKRYRDIYFQERDYSVSSIVITTLAARFYQQENSIFDAIDNILTRLTEELTNAGRFNKRFKIVNPVNDEEDFTDSWTKDHYDSLFLFLRDFHKKWQNLKHSFETSNADYIELFGEGVYKKSLNEQFITFSKSTGDTLIKSSSLIVGGSAYTDSKGMINDNKGIKNEAHHNFGGMY